MRRAAAWWLLVGALAACGKYGPPLRAEQAAKPAPAAEASDGASEEATP